MRKDEIRTIADAFAYYTDCQLATVCSMAMKKSRGRHEYERQMSIAQGMVDQFETFQINDPGNRAHDIKSKNQTVGEWAKRFEPETPNARD